jgi:probable rRNA maturation factor
LLTVRVFKIGLLPSSAKKPALIRKACEAAFKAEKSKIRGELGVVFLDRPKMRQMNRRFLNHGHDTDVIAFPFPAVKGIKDSPVGDIYISAHQARIQAKNMGHSVLREVLTLAVHGSLHLLGYRDSTPAQKRRMFRRQDVILDKISP